MANKASAERVAADMQPPNFRQAFKLLIGIKPKKDKISSVNGEIGDIYGKIEGCKVHRGAARIFLAMHGKEPEERVEMMRSLNGLIDAAGWDNEAADLVDQAGGNVVSMRVGGSGGGDGGEGGGDTGGGEGGEDDGDGDGGRNAAGEDVDIAAVAEQVEADAPAPRRASRKPASATEGMRASIALAKNHLGGPGYTGDNSDLAGKPH